MLAAARQMGDRLPPSIANAPELREDLQFYRRAFNDLSTSRPGGMAVMPIPWEAMQRYAAHYGADLDEFTEIIGALDEAYLSYVAKKHESKKT